MLWLPPYHCFFNPIELCWSKLKHHLKKNGKPSDTLEIYFQYHPHDLKSSATLDEEPDPGMDECGGRRQVRSMMPRDSMPRARCPAKGTCGFLQESND
ncbi:hypothetical protein NECAME_16591 [Necator americanus]|uniref:Tc1-like transposase DDE domain-containing protein n=1 Tax=Necator americanus TaxID=51031 RepID=W2TY01_NECAM|nr:hypothetical protein NECAME_16591 [Necator americanus]ETN85892.1 hypothetical protein NECAME_16591 [Necator americanus]